MKTRKHIFTTLLAIGSAGIMLSACGDGKGQTILNKLHLTEDGDTVKPVITAMPLSTNVGEYPDFMKNVTATDDSGCHVDISVDTSAVNINVGGEYTVTYIATDSVGNEARKDVPLQVLDLSQKVIYLTFDDGPSPVTPRVLKILRDNNVKATFFVTGQNPDCFHYIKQAHDEGHAIAAHSYTHNFAIYRSMKTYFDDLEKIERVIEQQTGSRTNVIRFPGGSSNTVSRRYNPNHMMSALCDTLESLGIQWVDWNLDSTDAAGNNRPAATLIAHACHAAHPQLCLLMHDTNAKKTTADALPEIIRYFKAQGYAFGTLNAANGKQFHHGIRRYPKHSTESRQPAATAKPAAQPAAKQTVKPAQQQPTESTQPAEQEKTEKNTEENLSV